MAQKKASADPNLTDGLIVPSKVGKSKEDWIGNQLKRIYDEALTEDIPDDMMSLLDQLDATTSAQKSKSEESTQ
ncbi:NepR family anti-sigma factor [Roseibium sp.]|uniref:NepR family anti-sigma factor n=1 Tax=Roseibium sp. TaxID=1936156 RepID=UPI003263C23B